MPKSSISLRCIWMRESHFRHFSSSWADPKKLWRLWNPCMIRIRWLRTLTLPSRWVKCSVLPVRDILFCWTMVVVSSVEPGVETCSSTESPAWFLVAPVPWLFYQYFPGLTWLLLDTDHFASPWSAVTTHELHGLASVNCSCWCSKSSIFPLQQHPCNS